MNCLYPFHELFTQFIHPNVLFTQWFHMTLMNNGANLISEAGSGKRRECSRTCMIALSVCSTHHSHYTCPSHFVWLLYWSHSSFIHILHPPSFKIFFDIWRNVFLIYSVWTSCCKHVVLRPDSPTGGWVAWLTLNFLSKFLSFLGGGIENLG